MNSSVLILAPDSIGTREIFGIPAARRLAAVIHRSGFRDIHFIGASDMFRPILSDYVAAENFHHAGASAPLSDVLKELPDFEQNFIVVRADTVLDRPTLKLLAGAECNSAVYMESAEGDGTGAVFLTTRDSLIPVADHLWSPRDNSPVAAVSRKIETRVGLPYSLSGGKPEIAEERLMDAMGMQTRETDGFLARHISRRVSRPLSRLLAATDITPNQITIANTMLGLVAAWLISLGSYASQLVGSALFVACVIADGIDGEVARLKLMESKFGHLLDIVTDNIVHVAVFLGLAVGLYRMSGNRLYLDVLWLMLGGLALNLFIVYLQAVKKGPDEQRVSSRSMRLMSLLNNRDFAYLIVLLALVGQLQVFLVGAAVGSYVFAAALLYFGRRG